jgi:isocitrate/isopropylmalate dehydrogenase
MAAATRALDGVAKLHGWALDDVHLPFAGEGVTRSGHPLPAATRAAYRSADAILVASAHEPALEGVKADLELASRVARVVLGTARDLVVVAPVDEWANSIALDRAFSCAAARRGRILAVGESSPWLAATARVQSVHDGLEVEQATFGETLVRLRERPQELDVVVAEAQLYSAVVDTAAHFAGTEASVAHAWLPDEGPGVFAPGSSETDEVAGLGVVDPTGMLLTASLLLAEGLEHRSASRTLERAVGEATRERTARDTRSFTDAVIQLLPRARTDVDHFDEDWR